MNSTALPPAGRVGIDHLLGLFAEAALQDRRAAGAQGRLVDVELVRVDRALDDGLAEAVAGGDEHRVAEAGFGVDREQHAGGDPTSERTMRCTPAESATVE